MKEFNLLFGVAIGVVAGMLIFKHNDNAKKMVAQGEKAIKKEVENMQKKIEKK